MQHVHYHDSASGKSYKYAAESKTKFNSWLVCLTMFPPLVAQSRPLNHQNSMLTCQKCKNVHTFSLFEIRNRYLLVWTTANNLGSLLFICSFDKHLLSIFFSPWTLDKNIKNTNLHSRISHASEENDYLTLTIYYHLIKPEGRTFVYFAHYSISKT